MDVRCNHEATMDVSYQRFLWEKTWKFQNNKQTWLLRVYAANHNVIPRDSLSHTVDGSEIPNNHLECEKPCKAWNVYHINWLSPDLFHRRFFLGLRTIFTSKMVSKPRVEFPSPTLPLWELFMGQIEPWEKWSWLTATPILPLKPVKN